MDITSLPIVSTPPESQEVTPTQAETPAVNVEDVKKRVLGHLSRMQNFRRPYDSLRFKWYRQYVSQRDDKFFPDGVTKRSNTFVPYAQSNVETVTSRTMDAFFSVRPFFEVNGRGESDAPAAEKMQLMLEFKLHQSKLPQHSESFIRSCGIYGTCGIKVDWDWGFDVVTYPETIPVMIPVLDQNGQVIIDPATNTPVQQPFVDPTTGQPVTQTRMATKKVPRNRPKFYVIDPYDLLVDPDGGVIAHCVEKAWGDLKREAEGYLAANGKPYYDPAELEKIANKLVAQKDPDSVIIRLAELWNEFDQTVTVMTFSEGFRETLSWKDARYAARSASNNSGFKRQIYAGEDVVLYTGENPFAHKRCPILYTSYLKVPGEPYGIGVIEPAADINEALNQMVSQIRDNWNVGINHRYLYDNTLDIDHEALNMANVPGGKIGVSGDPTRAIFPLPTFQPNSNDYSLLELYRNVIEQSTGISDFYAKGVGSPGANTTATGINSIINESNFRFRMFIRNMELDIFQPLLEMCSANIMQFITDEEEILVTDAAPEIPKYQRMRPEELIGSYSFDLVAANYASNEVIRQRNVMALMNTLGQSPFIDQYEGIKLLLKIFKIPEYSKLLKTQQQVDQEQQQEQQTQIQMMLMQHQMEMDKLRAAAELKMQAHEAWKNTNGGDDDKPTHFKPFSKEPQVGRPPRPTQPEGRIPGVGNTSVVREEAQANGMNGMGMMGMGEGMGG